MTNPLTVLVTGATGHQGGAVIQALLQRGHQVRALTRNTESPAAKRLTIQGVEMIKGDFDDPVCIAKALQGVDTFYLMGTPFEAGVERETKQGITLANAAAAANVGHLVYGSVANADKNTGIPHFESKYKVEQHIKTLDVPYTISAPVYFMENVFAAWAIDALKTGKIIQAMPGDRVLQQISVNNIGEFVASLIDQREAVFGKRFDIAGDEVSGQNMAGILSQATGYHILYETLPTSILREQSEDMAIMYEWFDEVGYDVDIPLLHQAYPEVHWQNYTQWAESQDWRLLNMKKTA